VIAGWATRQQRPPARPTRQRSRALLNMSLAPSWRSGPAAQSGLHRSLPRSPRRPPGRSRSHLPCRDLVVASLRRREVRRAGRHSSAELSNGASSLLPRRLARADVCPRRTNVAALTSAVRRETARNARAYVISGLSPRRSGLATPRCRGQHRCGAITSPRHRASRSFFRLSRAARSSGGTPFR